MAELEAPVAPNAAAVAPIDKRKVLVLDMNGVLVFRKRCGKTGSVRPYAAEFVAEMLRHFRVGVWSSMMEENALALVGIVFASGKALSESHTPRDLEFLWGQSHCCKRRRPNLPDGKPNHKPLLMKELRQVRDFVGSHSGEVVILDDSDEKLVDSDKRHHVPITTWNGDQSDSVLRPDGQLTVWLRSFASSELSLVDFASQHPITGAPNGVAGELLFLGTGTSGGVPQIGCGCRVCTSPDPRDKRLRTSALLTFRVPVPGMLSRVVTILIDPGPDFRQQALRCGLRKLDAVLITHDHQDHIGGIDDLRQVNSAMGRDSPPIPMYSTERVLNEVKTKFGYIWNADVQKGGGLPRLQLKAVIPYQQFQVCGVPVLPFTVMHGNLEILGFAVGDRCLAYITDGSQLPEQSAKLLESFKPDVMVINGLRKAEHPTHWTIQRAGEIHKQIAPKSGSFLVHLTHDAGGRHAELGAMLPPGAQIAYDGLCIKLKQPAQHQH